MAWPTIFTALLDGQDLGTTESAWAMDQIMSGEASPAQVAGFLMALRAKGETVDEMRGLADTMLAHASRIEVAGTTLDIVGTGGDRAHTVNISTMAALVAAASGVRVVKHGNRAASSSSGSADVLEALGINLTLSPSDVAAVVEKAGITFCFAQQFHPSMRHAAVARRDLGIGTVFNFLGPLTNPAQPTYAAVGVADARMAPLMAGVFAGRGKDAVVFRGDDGLDELTISTTSRLWWVRGGAVREYSLDPAWVGLERHPLETLRGRTRPTTPRSSGMCSPGRWDRFAMRWCSTPVSPWRSQCLTWARARPTSSPRCRPGWIGPARRSMTEAPRLLLQRWVTRDAGARGG